MRDSTGQADPHRYNAVHWNGNEWQVMRIQYNYHGTYYNHPIQTIFAFDKDNIWFAGNGVMNYNGRDFLPVEIPAEKWGPYQINKIWGTSSSDIYIAGNNGNLAHFDGNKWKKIESGATTDIQSIYGDYNTKLGEWEILAIAGEINNLYDGKIVRIKDTECEDVSLAGMEYHGGMMGLWFKSGIKYLVSSSWGSFENNKDENSLWRKWIPAGLNYYIYKISATGMNNIFAVGGHGELIHFNGSTFRSYMDITGFIHGNLHSVDIKNNIVVTTGIDNRQAVVFFGKR